MTDPDHPDPRPSGPPSFEVATVVRPLGDGTTYRADLAGAYAIDGRPNGGYLLAVMARAVAAGVAQDGQDQPHPLTASAVYLRPAEIGPASVLVEVIRTGRTASQARATLLQGDRACAEGLFTMGRLRADPPVDYDDEPPAAVAPWEECLPFADLRPDAAGGPSIHDATEVRLDPTGAGFATGRPGGRADVRGWVRLDGLGPADPLPLLFVADLLPPATCEIGSIGWVPTAELTVYLRALPAPGTLRVRQWARLVRGGLVDERCEVWDARDQLVAQAVQLALVRMPGPA